MLLTLRILAAVLLLAVPAFAGTLTGTVRNSTTNLPAAGVDLALIGLQGGMQSLASTRTDAQGRFSFDNPAIGAGPVLVRAIYKGVNYHANVPPGTTTATIEIFEAATDPSVLSVESRYVVVQPNGPRLIVGEEYSVHNHSKPPATFFAGDGTFVFALPAGAELKQVSAWGPAAMPLVQGTIEKGKDRYAIAFALKPGENGVRISYEMPYATNAAVVGAPSPYLTKAVAFIAPPQMQISGQGFSPAGQQQGWNVFERRDVPAGAALGVNVSGTAPPPQSDPAMPADSSAPAAQPGVNVQQIPARLHDLQWILIGGFAALFSLGALYLWKRPLSAVSPVPSAASTFPGVYVEEIPASTKPAPGVQAEVDRHVRASLDDLKDRLFRLELRRQAGTISDDDYTREKSRLDSLLREFLKG